MYILQQIWPDQEPGESIVGAFASFESCINMARKLASENSESSSYIMNAMQGINEIGEGGGIARIEEDNTIVITQVDVQ